MHSFDPKIAEIVGLAPAVIYQNIVWWIAKNEANDTNKFDGHYWTYNSVKAFSVLFPYLTEDQVRRALDKLVEKNLIVVGNYNKSAYDRTKWFRLACQLDLANLPNGFGSEGEPIPDIKPDDKHLLDTDVSKRKRARRLSEDWNPTERDTNEAFQMGLTIQEIDNEAAKFRDYWIAKSGKDATKLDWSATWRNWIRRVVESRGKGKVTAGQPIPFPNKQGLSGRAGAALRSLQERQGLDRGW